MIAGNAVYQLRADFHASAVECVVVAAATARDCTLDGIAFGRTRHYRAAQIRIATISKHFSESVRSRRRIHGDVFHATVAAVDKADRMRPVADRLRVAVRIAAERPDNNIAHFAFSIFAASNRIPPLACLSNLLAAHAHRIHKIASLAVVCLYWPATGAILVSLGDFDIPPAVRSHFSDDALREGKTMRIVNDSVLDCNIFASVKTYHPATDLPL